MSVTLRTLDSTATLPALKEAIRQAEGLGFRLISFMAGRAVGKPANLITLLQAMGGAAPTPLALEVIDENLSQDAQEAQLNTGGRELVAYGSLYVEGQPRNVIAYR